MSSILKQPLFYAKVFYKKAACYYWPLTREGNLSNIGRHASYAYFYHEKNKKQAKGVRSHYRTPDLEATYAETAAR